MSSVEQVLCRHKTSESKKEKKKKLREPTVFEPLAKKFRAFREKQIDLVGKKSEKSVLSVGE